MRIDTGISNIVFGLSLLLLALPLASSSAISSSASAHTLHKRWYSFQSRWASKDPLRFYGTIGVAVKCMIPGAVSELEREAQYFNWPWSLRGGALKVVKRFRKCRYDTIHEWDEWDEFPTNDEELVSRLVSEGSSWNPPISKNEAYKAMHQLDPNEFPYADYDAKWRSAQASLASGIKSLAAASEPIVPGVSKNCKKFYKVKSGDRCYLVAENNGITLADFYQWNEKVNEGGECTQLWVGYSYCVGF